MPRIFHDEFRDACSCGGSLVAALHCLHCFPCSPACIQQVEDTATFEHEAWTPTTAPLLALAAAPLVQKALSWVVFRRGCVVAVAVDDDAGEVAES